MAEEQVDYSQVYDFLYRIERRIGFLERDASFIEKQVIFLDDKKLKGFDALSTELKNVRSDISELKNHLGKCAHRMTLLSKDLRDTVKTDDIQTLNSSMDNLQFEEYVTKKDVQRGL
jgi:hypothetical protein